MNIMPYLISVHGCFWHRNQGYRYATTPEQNRARRQEKFKQNVERDRRQINELVRLGWRVVVIEECSLRLLAPELPWLPKDIKAGIASYVEWPMPPGLQ